MSQNATRKRMDGTGLFLLSGEDENEFTAAEAAPDGVSHRDEAAQEQIARPKKNSTTVRIDADVLEWLREPGKGYQSRLNAILRRKMLDAQRFGRASQDSGDIDASSTDCAGTEDLCPDL